MKTLNAIKLTAMTLLAAATLTACGNSGGSANNSRLPYNPYYPQNCTGCTGGTQSIGTATGDSFWMGSQQVEAQLTLNLFEVASNYGVKIAANGRFDMALPYATACGVPPGSYQVTTVTPGDFGGTTFGNMQILATGPTQVMIFIPQGAMSDIGGRLTGVAYMNSQSEGCKLLVR